MRFITGFFSFGILITMVIVSFGHGVALFESYGYKGNTPLLATGALEALYVISGMAILHQRKNGQELKFSTMGGFVFASLMVGWANVASSYMYGVGGWLIGLAIPMTIAWSKGIFLDTIATAQQKKKSPETEKITEPIKQAIPLETEDKPTSISTNESTRNEPTELVENQPDVLVEDVPTEIVEHQPIAVEESTKQPTKDQPINLVENVLDEPIRSTKVSTNEPTNISTKFSTNKPTKNQPTELVENASVNKDESTSVSTRKKESVKAKSTNKPTKNPIDKTTKLALKLYEKQGKLPSRSELMKRANCTQYQARKTLSELKQQIS